MPGQDPPPVRPDPGQRTCTGCGLPLSRYNPSPRCQACTSATRDPARTGPAPTAANGPKIRQLRRARGMTQQHLADRSGISLSYIEKLERGSGTSPTIATLTAIAAALNTPLADLLTIPPAAAPAPPPPGRAEDFTAILRWHMNAQGMSTRKTARAAGYADHTLLSKVLNGHKAITPHMAAKLDAALSANGAITAAAQPAVTAAGAAKKDTPARAGTRGKTSAVRAMNGGEGTADLNARITSVLQDESRIGHWLGRYAEPLALILTGSAVSEPGTLPDTGVLASEVDNARRQYQACRYSGLARQLPGLLSRLDLACATLGSDARARACALSADAYHVTAGLLLKFDDQGLASLAADRSMRAAQASEDPVTVAASARIITHTLMSGGHLPAAVSAASSHAARLDHAMTPHTPDSLSVYGALLLRGAIAAALHDDRRSAHELLGEADEAARQLGADTDGNLRWTAFGPVNAMLHRVNIAVTLGDAGTAIDVARGVDLTKITVTERKAALLIDVARAFLQWGRHEKAYTALRAAEATAHEEVSSRPSVLRLVRELRAAAPPGIRADVDQFATQIGVPR